MSEIPKGMGQAFAVAMEELGFCSTSWLFVRAVAEQGGEALVERLRDQFGRTYPVLDAVAAEPIGHGIENLAIVVDQQQRALKHDADSPPTEATLGGSDCAQRFPRGSTCQDRGVQRRATSQMATTASPGGEISPWPVELFTSQDARRQRDWREAAEERGEVVTVVPIAM